ncbi:FHA domain-containing protein [Cryobacterium sp. PH29-G1]|uniref:FHA domain-containing protein n=1 Tax=Cryobacterium sp. PH29-G1 TaxID=3046211 RepID=UPI0024BB57A3|nr:FHA domain-containing protein [Cryobacterium sp. PH29-G1]MDJ0350053.1 FHA domain-containing protein [Cryobacterium sp. PH29-G1]
MIRVDAALGRAPDAGMLVGVVAATLGRRSWAYLIDAAPLVVLLVAMLVLGFSSGPTAALVWLAAVALCYIGAHSFLYAQHGRSFGRYLLRLRSVDGLSGTPLGVVALVLRPPRPLGTRVTVTADLSQGRDPLAVVHDPLATTRLTPPASATPTSATPTASTAAASTAKPSAPRPSTASAPPDSSPSSPDGYEPQKRSTDHVTIVLDSGQTQQVRTTLLIGRRPANQPGGAQHPLFPWTDMSRTLSKTHALISWSGTALIVTDLGSANGTTLITDAGERQILPAGVGVAAAPGWSVHLGDRSFLVRGGTAQYVLNPTESELIDVI